MMVRVAFILYGLLGLAATAHAQCPSMRIDDVLRDPRVQEALERAWADSQEGTPGEHEEGGHIFQCRVRNADGSFRYYTLVLRWASGDGEGISSPPAHGDADCRLVASFHTHPGPASDHPESDGYDNHRPSHEDVLASYEEQIPGIIRYGHGSEVQDVTYPSSIREPSDPAWRCPRDAIDRERGGAHGEPHILTFSGERYDFQAVGEFYGLRIGTIDAHEVQLRLEPYKNSERVTIVTGVALRCGKRVIELAAGQEAIRIDGDDVRLIGQLKKDPAVIRALWSSVEITGCPQGTLEIARNGEFLNVMLEPDAELLKQHPGMTAGGILGAVGGSPRGTLPIASGATIPLPRKPVGKEHPLYQEFAKSWRVPPEKSLFSFPVRNPLTQTNPTRFPSSVEQPSLAARRSAREQCERGGVTEEPYLSDCAYDFAVTGEKTFIHAAAALSAPTMTPEPQGTISLNQRVEGTVTKFHAPHEYTLTLRPGTYRLVSELQPAVRWAIFSTTDRKRLATQYDRFKPMKTIYPFITGGAGEFRIILGMSSVDREGKYSFTVEPVK